MLCPQDGQRNQTLSQQEQQQDPTGHSSQIPIQANGSAGHRTLECEINAAVQSIETQHQLNMDTTNSAANYTVAPTLQPLAVMPGYRNQPTSAHVNLGANNPTTASWPVAGAPPAAAANMAAMLNAENATSTMIQHAHAMSALYHTPWGMGQH